MRTEIVEIATGGRRLTDVTDHCRRFVRDAGDGLVHLFLPHATAGLALFETGAGSEEDVLEAVDRLFPSDDRYRHAHGSPGHGRDHVLPAFVAPSLTLPVVDSSLALGTWQSVVLVDTNVDNPQRRLRLTFLPG